MIEKVFKLYMGNRDDEKIRLKYLYEKYSAGYPLNVSYEEELYNYEKSFENGKNPDQDIKWYKTV